MKWEDVGMIASFRCGPFFGKLSYHSQKMQLHASLIMTISPKHGVRLSRSLSDISLLAFYD